MNLTGAPIFGEAVSWLSTALVLGALVLLRRHEARLPALEADPPLPQVPPRVCLCIPVRNEARELPAALDSWLAQDYPALRILVVDDGSTDGSTEILRDREAAHPDRLRVLRNDHLPPGWLGKNHALDLASRQPEARAADWLLFADGDVQASKDLLRRAMAFALEPDPKPPCAATTPGGMLRKEEPAGRCGSSFKGSDAAERPPGVVPLGWGGGRHPAASGSNRIEPLCSSRLSCGVPPGAPSAAHGDFGTCSLAQPTDVLALIPAIDAKGPAERMILPLAASAFLMAVPPHQVPNPRHPAFCGVGGFTLVRREAYEAVGGHGAAPLEAIDDMMLARRLKAAGYTNRVARGGPGLHLRMYHGLGELLVAMRKNAAALPLWWLLLPPALPLVLMVGLAPLWLPFAGHPVLALLLWLLVPALVGDGQQRMTGRPMDLLWAFWPLNALVFAVGTAWALGDRLRGVNHWRGRDVKLR